MDSRPRRMTPDDFPAAGALLRAAYRNENDYTERLRRHLDLEPAGWLVAREGGALLGCAGATVMGPVGYVGLVGVHPARQRQGIATALMEALISWLRAQGCSTILLDASDAGQPLYLGMGFVVEDTVEMWRRMEGALQARPTSGGARVMPYRASDLADIIAFDTAWNGAPRNRVIAAYIADNPELVRVARGSSGAIAGYMLIQASSGTGGPWIAEDAVTARALVVDALARHPGLIEVVMAPAANPAAATILLESGFTRFRSLAHMRLGAPLDPLRRQRVYGQAALSLG